MLHAIRCLILFLPPMWLGVHVLRLRGLDFRLRLALLAPLVGISQTDTVNGLLFKNAVGPDMPAWLLVPQLWLYVAFLVLFALVACLDLLRLTRWALRRFRRKTAPRRDADFSPGRRAVLRRGVGAALTLGLPAGASALCLAGGMALPLVRRMTLAVPDLPPGLDGLKIAHLTDLHIGPLTSLDWVRRVVDLTRAEAPDLVCLTGDLTDGEPDFQVAGGGTRREAVGLLAGLAAPSSAFLGVFGCTGNHEFFCDYAGWMREYAAAGIHMLHREGLRLERNGSRLALIGLDDRTGNRFGHPVNVDRNALFAAFPGRAEGGFRIVMDHRPDTASDAATAGADLQLSGHTHGGQCPGLDRVVADLHHGLVRGWYRVAGMPLYVSSGAGVWQGYPVRLGVPAELAVITLQRGPASPMREIPAFVRAR